MTLLDQLRTRLRSRRHARRDPARARLDILAPRTRLVCVLVIIAALLVLPVGRGLGYGIADALCTGYGCAQATGTVPQCRQFGRDRAIAAETLSFTRSAIDRPDLHLRGAGDGSVEITAAPEAVAGGLPGGRRAPAGSRLSYRFASVDEARHWLLDHTASTGRAVDATTGPGDVGLYAGYLRTMAATGLQRTPGRSPSLITTPLHLPQPAVLSEELSTGARTQTIVPDVPLADTPAFEQALNRLGIGEAAVIEVLSTGAGEPQRLRIGGWGAEAWSLSALRAPDSAQVDVHGGVETGPDGLRWRSYSLDLRRETNRRVFEAVTSVHLTGQGEVVSLATGLFDFRVGAGELDRNPYEALVERLREDAVFVESRVRVPAAEASVPAGVPSVERLRETFLRDPAGPGVALTAAEVRAADLSLAGSQPGDVLDCDTPAAPGDADTETSTPAADPSSTTSPSPDGDEGAEEGGTEGPDTEAPGTDAPGSGPEESRAPTGAPDAGDAPDSGGAPDAGDAPDSGVAPERRNP